MLTFEAAHLIFLRAGRSVVLHLRRLALKPIWSQDGGEGLYPRIPVRRCSASLAVFVCLWKSLRLGCWDERGSLRWSEAGRWRGNALHVFMMDQIWLLTCFCVSLLTRRRLQTAKLPKLLLRPAAACGLWTVHLHPTNVYFIRHKFILHLRGYFRFYWTFKMMEFVFTCVTGTKTDLFISHSNFYSSHLIHLCWSFQSHHMVLGFWHTRTFKL